jgi:hypothetical protein
MKNVVLAMMLSLGVMACVDQEETDLSTDEAALSEKDPGDVSAQDARRQCRVTTASLRNEPGGGIVYTQVPYNAYIQVYGKSGVWLYASYGGFLGWTLEEYYCR